MAESTLMVPVRVRLARCMVSFFTPVTDTFILKLYFSFEQEEIRRKIQAAIFRMRILLKYERLKFKLFLDNIQNIDGEFSVTFAMRNPNHKYAGIDIF
jgi:hypothetical protein